ncbi:MAG TPA: hypothetical protein PLP64_01290 [Pseudothermotoga sp.]|nr:hypothetical protein [Pseudothermotoga sp.]HOK82843.1 hypothetical protein [Pseudothermotoga sp.]HPP69984.1 hypothetical protein [Pseudothermotoga sp.]
MRGSLLTEAVISLLLVSILLVFGFESISLSLAQTNKIESKVQAAALLDFVYGYLSKYEIGHDVSNISADVINNLYWNGSVKYPKLKALQFQNVSRTTPSQIIYRKVKVTIELRPTETDDYDLIFGL